MNGARERLDVLLSAMPDAVAVADRDGRLVEWNARAEALFGARASEVLGRPIDEVAAEQGATRAEREGLERVLRGDVIRYETHRRDADGRRVDLSGVLSPIRDGAGDVAGAMAVWRDVTSLRRAERARDRAAARSRFLAQASQLLARSLDLDRTLRSVASLLVPDWADASVLALRGADGAAGELRAVAAEHADPQLRTAVEALFGHHAEVSRREGMIERAIRTGRPVLAPDYRDPPGRGRRGLAALGVRSLLVAPLRVREDVLGVLVVAMTDRSSRRFGAEDADLAQDVADRAAQAIDNARSYRAARAAEERFRATFEDAPIGVALLHVDAEGGTRYAEVNAALCRILGETREALVGAEADHLELGEQRLLRADGQERWVQVQAAPVTSASGEPQAFITQVLDITERRRFERRLEHLATYDVLTGVLNRRRFGEEVDRALAGARRHGEPAALILLDLDDFKHLNDTHGHGTGDEFLRAAARALRERVRATDAVGRLGGDEFGIVLGHTGPAEAAAVAENLVAAFRTRIGVDLGERAVRVTASAGVRALTAEGGETADELLGEADMALFDAKERGGDRVSIAGRPDSPIERLRLHGRWRRRIRDALDRDGFVLYEQPIMRLADGAIDRAEILIRMLGESGGDELVPPAAFLPVAERYDHVRDIDRWVVRHALRLLARRQAEGSTVGLSINLSGDSLGDASVIDFILAEIDSAGVDPSTLTFEVTETTAIGNLDRARVLAEQLAELGCDFALDDFGAGFGSFAYLKHLPLDVIKIDGEFIRSLPHSPQDQVTVRAIVDIAKGLGKETVAEYVEDEATLELLRTLGVDRVQGFHVGRPRPAEPVPAF